MCDACGCQSPAHDHDHDAGHDHNHDEAVIVDINRSLFEANDALARANREHFDEARIVVRDEGPGFDVASLPDIMADPSSLAEGQGRGLVLIRMFMDDVSFNPEGNEISLVKRAVDRSPS